MTEDPFTKSYSTVLLVKGILNRLGAGNMGTFNDRLKTQKVQYLAQVFRISPEYIYNFYIHGPYSPDLAHDLYALETKGFPLEDQKFLSMELEERFEDLRKFLQEKDNRNLELVATLHWLRKVALLNPSETKEKLKELKRPSEKELKETLENYEGLP